MATAENLRKAANTAQQAQTEQAEKPLPAMVAPTVTLPEELRQACALRARDTKESFSPWCAKLVAAALVAEKRVTQAVVDKIDWTPKRGGGGGALKGKLDEALTRIALLTAQLEAAKKAAGQTK